MVQMSITRLPCAALLVLAGCGKNEDSGPKAESCEAPVASAGADLSLPFGGGAELDGSGSAICSSRAEESVWTWLFELRPEGSSIDDADLSENRTATASAPSFVPDMVGDYVLSLTIDDGELQSSPDLVRISVTASDSAPSASCAEGASGKIDEAIVLDGSASSDPDGQTLSYSWALAEVPSCSALGSGDLLNATTATPSLVADCPGSYMVTLVVSDGDQDSAADICTVEVAETNTLPIADAGPDVEEEGCVDQPYPLNGWSSYDQDGDEITYSWAVVSTPDGATASISDEAAPAPTLDWDLPGTYTLKLQVADSLGESAPDIVSYTFPNISLNTAPSANAGEDHEVDLEPTCINSSGTWVCEPCREAVVELDGSLTEDADGDSFSFLWSVSSGTGTLANEQSPFATFTIPERAAQYRVRQTATVVLSLSATDCSLTGEDTVTITYSCNGNL
jgi:hypothetical protein